MLSEFRIWDMCNYSFVFHIMFVDKIFYLTSVTDLIFMTDDHHKHIATFEVKEALAKLWGKMRHYSG